MDAWLAYRILSAGLVPVNDLGTQAYDYYCRVGGMVSRISTNSAHEVSGAKRRSDLSCDTNSRDVFFQIRGSIICAKTWTHPFVSPFHAELPHGLRFFLRTSGGIKINRNILLSFLVAPRCFSLLFSRSPRRVWRMLPLAVSVGVGWGCGCRILSAATKKTAAVWVQ